MVILTKTEDELIKIDPFFLLVFSKRQPESVAPESLIKV